MKVWSYGEPRILNCPGGPGNAARESKSHRAPGLDIFLEGTALTNIQVECRKC